MVFVLLLLLAVGAVGLALAVVGAAVLGRVRGRPGEGFGGAGPPLAVVGGAVGLFLALGVLTMGLGALRGTTGDDHERQHAGGASDTAAPPPTTTTAGVAAPRAAATTTVPQRGAVAAADVAGSRAVLGPVVRLAPSSEAQPIGGLRPGTVLRVEVAGFPSLAAVQARQCAGGICGNPVKAQLDVEGRAQFQYLVTDDFLGPERTQGCRVHSAPCTIEVANTDGQGHASLVMLFHDALPPPGSLRATPTTRLRDGAQVRVQLEGFPAGAAVRLVLCASGASPRPGSCGRPGLDVPLDLDARGGARTTVQIEAGPVGRNGGECGEGSGCSLAVVSDDAFVRAPRVPVTFLRPPGASYDGGRITAGLLVAALLLAVAWWLLRRTDWSPIGEEAAPEIDEAEYADLDAIVAALPPEPTLDELVTAATR